MEKQISISDLREGNHQAYEMLFTQWYAPLCDYAYGMVYNTNEAEDIVQKMFCKLWDQREKIDIHTSVKSYLYRIIHNDCINKIKQQKNREEHNQQLAYFSSSTVEDTSNQLIYNELEQKIDTAIESLPPRCKEVFKLSRYSYLSYAEIAEKLDISSHTVEKQISKALQVLRNDLQDYLIVLTVFLIIF